MTAGPPPCAASRSARRRNVELADRVGDAPLHREIRGHGDRVEIGVDRELQIGKRALEEIGDRSRIDVLEPVDFGVLGSHLRHVELGDELLGMIDFVGRPREQDLAARDRYFDGRRLGRDCARDLLDVALRNAHGFGGIARLGRRRGRSRVDRGDDRLDLRHVGGRGHDDDRAVRRNDDARLRKDAAQALQRRFRARGS